MMYKNKNKNPLCKIIFRDREVSRKYKKSVKEFMRKLILQYNPDEPDFDSSDLELDIWEDEFESSIEENITSELSCVNSRDMYQIDTSPSRGNNFDFPVPLYDKKINVTMEETTAVKGKNGSELTPTVNCFNCLGNHNLRDCQKPRDFNLIAQRKKEYVNKNPRYTGVRYHKSDDNRLSHIRPGYISKNLRQALNISKHQLPLHIYKMRIHGYPPGWLEEAKITHSGLALYGSDGKAVREHDEEEGEIVEVGSKDKYDGSKIISFPGFNVPFGTKVKDECKMFGCPEMSYEQSKDKMLKDLKTDSKLTKAYKRKKLTDISGGDTDCHPEDNFMSDDMEVDCSQGPETKFIDIDNDECRFIPPLPEETPYVPPPPPPDNISEDVNMNSENDLSNENEDDDSISCNGYNSPQLQELEEKKNLLLQQLDEQQEICRSDLSTPVNFGKIKTFSLGTPVLKSLSPFSQLPSSEKWSRDICDVINFENLPDSTGKFQNMRGILQKVRSRMSEIQQLDDM